MDTPIVTPRGPVAIRFAREEDAAAYRDLRLEALRNHPEAFSSDYAEHLAKPMAFWTQRLLSSGSDDGVTLYFATVDQELVGMCGLACTVSPKLRHSGSIVSMYVRPDWRGLGIAQALVNACLEWARGLDVKVVKLGVVTTNAAAIRCYARCGFWVYGIEPQALCHDGVFYDELLMVWTT